MEGLTLSSFSQEPTWDTNSAFFARAAGRNPVPTPPTSSTTVKNNTPSTISQSSQIKNSSSQQPAAEQIDPVVLRSRQVAGWYHCGSVNQYFYSELHKKQNQQQNVRSGQTELPQNPVYMYMCKLHV